jgi:hypothetical protein
VPLPNERSRGQGSPAIPRSHHPRAPGHRQRHEPRLLCASGHATRTIRSLKSKNLRFRISAFV